MRRHRWRDGAVGSGSRWRCGRRKTAPACQRCQNQPKRRSRRPRSGGRPQVHATRGDPFPRMCWPTNKDKLACFTMFTIFFGGDRFAPDLEIDGEPAQRFLQRHYIAALGTLAAALKDEANVAGFGSMNESFVGAAAAAPSEMRRGGSAAPPRGRDVDISRAGSAAPPRGRDVDIPRGADEDRRPPTIERKSSRGGSRRRRGARRGYSGAGIAMPPRGRDVDVPQAAPGLDRTETPRQNRGPAPQRAHADAVRSHGPGRRRAAVGPRVLRVVSKELGARRARRDGLDERGKNVGLAPRRRLRLAGPRHLARRRPRRARAPEARVLRRRPRVFRRPVHEAVRRRLRGGDPVPRPRAVAHIRGAPARGLGSVRVSGF